MRRQSSSLPTAGYHGNRCRDGRSPLRWLRSLLQSFSFRCHAGEWRPGGMCQFYDNEGGTTSKNPGGLEGQGRRIRQTGPRKQRRPGSNPRPLHQATANPCATETGRSLQWPSGVRQPAGTCVMAGRRSGRRRPASIGCRRRAGIPHGGWLHRPRPDRHYGANASWNNIDSATSPLTSRWLPEARPAGFPPPLADPARPWHAGGYPAKCTRTNQALVIGGLACR